MAGTILLRVEVVVERTDLLGMAVDHADAEVGAKDKRTSGDRNFMVEVEG